MTVTKSGRSPGWIEEVGPGRFPRGVIEGLIDIEAIESHHPDDAMPGRTAYECLVRSAALDPGKTAVIALEAGGSTRVAQRLTYADYLSQATAAANMFRSAAAGIPSNVAIILPILPEALVAAWGACAAGTVTPINPHLEPALITSILNATRATVLITTRAHGRSAADHIAAIRAKVPTLRMIYTVGDDGPFPDFLASLADHSAEALTFSPCTDRGAEAMYLPTGGTTAAPKLARLTHGGMALSAWIAGAVMGAAADEVIGLGMPLFHVGGMLMLGLRGAALGQTVLLLSPAGFRDRGVVENFWNIARAHGMTSLIATPTSAAALHAAEGEDHRGHVIRTFSSGGSTVPMELGRAFPQRFGVEIREVWGSTEFHGFLGCQPNGVPPLIGSVGLRTPWHRIKAVELDADNRFVREMPAGEQGVIIGAGPCLALGYVDPSLDDQFFVKDGPDGLQWGSSGDLGRVDADGYVWIDGRAKDVIIRGGHNIDPALIEEVLAAHPDVLFAAAVGYPDRSKGELPVAYIEAAPGRTCDVETLLAHCRSTIQERAACPVAIFALDSMPLTPVGKIFKPALRERALRHAVTAASRTIIGKDPDAILIDATKGRPHVIVRVPNVSEAEAMALKTALDGFSFTAAVDASSTL
ncbi:AMP-binding protein [Sphingomonas floccifaciens]|uniref:AMP-binding protein n=1 Tax=Sphingomonas floccifaciens TaxID=1844115 RepID=A0ABW4NIA4_9SPHN